jgi:hypothetical protein
MIEIEFAEVTQEVLEKPRGRDGADERKRERAADLAQPCRVHVLKPDDAGLCTTDNVLHLVAEKPGGYERIRRLLVIIGAVWFMAGIATWINLATIDGPRCQYLHDQTACARLEWQSALALAKKRIEARL